MSLRTQKTISLVFAALCCLVFFIFIDAGATTSADGLVEPYGGTRVLKIFAVGVPAYLVALFILMRRNARRKEGD